MRSGFVPVHQARTCRGRDRVIRPGGNALICRPNGRWGGGGGQTLTRGNGRDKTVMFRTLADSERCCGSFYVYCLLSGMLNFQGFVLLPACFNESRWDSLRWNTLMWGSRNTLPQVLQEVAALHENTTYCVWRCVGWGLQSSLLEWWMSDTMVFQVMYVPGWVERCLWAVVRCILSAGFLNSPPPQTPHPAASFPAVGARWPLVAPPGQLDSADCDERYLMD